MPFLGLGVIGLFLFALWIYCIFNVVTTDESDCRNLPKLFWLVIVIILPTIGSIVWLIAGRPLSSGVRHNGALQPSPYPEYERPGRHIAADPESDEEFLRRCRERAEEQRQAYRRKQQGDGPADAAS